ALLQSPWAPADLAAAFLDAACSVRPEPVAVANYAIACARLGRWSEVRRCIEMLRNVAHTEVRRLVMALEAAATGERAELAAVLPPFGIDRTGVELFERERALERVYSLTDGASEVPPAAPVAAPRPAPAPAHTS